jgi:hypothetical protein
MFPCVIKEKDAKAARAAVAKEYEYDFATGGPMHKGTFPETYVQDCCDAVE